MATALNQRSLYGIAGGLAAPQEGGFLGGLFSGLSGTLGGFAKYTDQTHEQERQRIRDMIEERRYQERMAMENERLGMERRRLAIAERPSAAEDYTVPYTTPEGDIQRTEPFYTQGVAPALKKTAGAQFFQQQYARPERPDPFALWLKKQEWEKTHPEPPKLRADVLERIDGINQMNAFDPKDRATLENIVKNPATQEEREAAERKIRSAMNWLPQPTR